MIKEEIDKDYSKKDIFYQERYHSSSIFMSLLLKNWGHPPPLPVNIGVESPLFKKCRSRL